MAGVLTTVEPSPEDLPRAEKLVLSPAASMQQASRRATGTRPGLPARADCKPRALPRMEGPRPGCTAAGSSPTKKHDGEFIVDASAFIRKTVFA